MSNYIKNVIMLVFFIHIKLNASECVTPTPSDPSGVRVAMATPTTMADELSRLQFLGHVNHDGSEFVQQLASQTTTPNYRRPQSVAAFVEGYNDYISLAVHGLCFSRKEGNATIVAKGDKENAAIARAAIVLVLVKESPTAIDALRKAGIFFDCSDGFLGCLVSKDPSRGVFKPIRDNE